ncbi:hypothetical protein FACS1894113_4330 [Alphaproteobacteria bacterium]|nr:hypothetical protein FACS1894113_4330 [Alphaproteobacteria bacterium]
MRNVVIIGSGPAGLACAIYAGRAGLEPVIIAGDRPGGQLVNTDIIENYPGFSAISGADLMMKMMSQAEELGAEIVHETVKRVVESKDGFFELTLSSTDVITAKTVAIATGAKHRHLGVSGETEFSNKGVSWCATCDGPMFRGKRVAVVVG